MLSYTLHLNKLTCDICFMLTFNVYVNVYETYTWGITLWYIRAMIINVLFLLRNKKLIFLFYHFRFLWVHIHIVWEVFVIGMSLIWLHLSTLNDNSISGFVHRYILKWVCFIFLTYSIPFFPDWFIFKYKRNLNFGSMNW